MVQTAHQPLDEKAPAPVGATAKSHTDNAACRER